MERGFITGEKTLDLLANTSPSGLKLAQAALDGIVAVGISYSDPVEWCLARTDALAVVKFASGLAGTFRDSNAVREIPVVNRSESLYIRAFASASDVTDGLSYWMVHSSEES